VKKTVKRKTAAKDVKAKATPTKEGKRMCSTCKKAAPKSARSKFCRPCYKDRRKKQLADNNVVWRKRVASGKAGHHLRYRNRPTEWAKEHKSQALKAAKKLKFGTEEVVKIIEKHVVAQPKRATA
jgi:hypothetical protein